MRRIFVLALALGACAPEKVVQLRFDDDPIHRAVNEVRSFVYPNTTSCRELDPRGLPYGDAEQRTRLTALSASRGPLQETIAELGTLPSGEYSLAVEAWGLPCEKRGESGPSGPGCEKLARDGRPILRAYGCTTVDLSSNGRDELDLGLETMARIGSLMRVPPDLEGAVKYDADSPLPLVEGEAPHDALFVQLQDENGDPLDDVVVRWSIAGGSAWFANPERQITATGDVGGVSSNLPAAGATASTTDEGAIVIEAYAPGFEDSPIELHAKALRGFELDVRTIALPRTAIDLSGTDPEFRPVVADDLDQDGFTDLALLGGREGRCPDNEGLHQLAVLMGGPDMGFRAIYSPPMTKQARAMTSAKIDPEGTRALIVSTSAWCGAYRNTPHGDTWVVRSPAIEVWTGFATPEESWSATPRELAFSTPCMGSSCDGPPVPLTRAAISIDAADVSGDHVDELAMSRCSYVTEGGAVVRCHGEMGTRTDSELVVMKMGIDGGQVVKLEEVAHVASTVLDQGYRDVRLADLSGDGSLDLIAVTQNEVGMVCGRQRMPDTGYGFAAPDARRIDATIGISQAFSLAVGRFDRASGLDVLVAGGHRASSPDAGIKLYPSEACGWGKAKEALITGPTTFPRFIVVRTADLNADGFDDALLLHRETRTLEILAGSGTNVLAKGPKIVLPDGLNGELGLHVDHPGEHQTAIAVTTAPATNEIHVIRVRPAS